jgi:hypothetical protein
LTLSIVQTNQGSTGSTDKSSTTVSLPAVPQAGNSLVLFVAATPTGSVSPVDPPWIFDGPEAGWGVTNAPHLCGFGAARQNTAKSWSVAFGASVAVAWLLAEVVGLLHADGDAGLVADSSVLAVDAFGTSGSSLSTGNSGQTAQYGSNLLLASFAARTASGTVPAFQAVANDPAGQEGTWTRLGASVATSKASGPNVRLDVFSKFAAGSDTYGALGTWAASTGGRAAAVQAYRSA